MLKGFIFNPISYPKASIDRRNTVINQISTANNEMADGTVNIATKTSVILQKSNEVAVVARETKENSENLKSVVSKFKI